MISYCSHAHAQADPTADALSIDHLKVAYPKSQDRWALNNINLRIAKGKSIALVGANGAGKSTLFKTIVGLLTPKSGSVKVFGLPLRSCHHRVVYLPQRSEIDWAFPLSVRELVMSGRYVNMGWFARPSQKDSLIVEQSMENLKVVDISQRQISKLSGGQQQRVLLARAIAQGADLFLLDEPLNAVDRATRDLVGDVLSDLKSKGKTVVVATHYYDEEEGRYDDALYLRDGNLINSKSAQAPAQDERDCC